MRRAPIRTAGLARFAALLVLAALLLMRIGPICETMAEAQAGAAAAMPCHPAPAPAKSTTADTLCAVGCCALAPEPPIHAAPLLEPVSPAGPAPARRLRGWSHRPFPPPPRLA
jgi:hypothetical protein